MAELAMLADIQQPLPVTGHASYHVHTILSNIHNLTYNPDYDRLGVHAAVQAEVARATSAAIPL